MYEAKPEKVSLRLIMYG